MKEIIYIHNFYSCPHCHISSEQGKASDLKEKFII